MDDLPDHLLSEEWYLLADGKCFLRSINFFSL